MFFCEWQVLGELFFWVCIYHIKILSGDLYEDSSIDTELKYTNTAVKKRMKLFLWQLSSTLVFALNFKVFMRQDHLTLNV